MAERKKFAVIADETFKAEEKAGSGNLAEYKIHQIQRWIVEHEEDDEKEHEAQREEIAQLKSNQTWWTGAAASAGLILGVVGAVAMAVFVWMLGLVKITIGG